MKITYDITLDEFGVLTVATLTDGELLVETTIPAGQAKALERWFAVHELAAN